MKFLLLLLLLPLYMNAQTPYAYYPFNGNVKDSSGNGGDTSGYGGQTGRLGITTPTTDRFNIANKAYHISGVKKGITIPAVGDYTFNGITVSIWVKTTTTYTVTQVLSGSICTFYLNVYNFGTFLASFNGNVFTKKKTNTTGVVTTGQWINLTATNNGDTTKLYINGILESTYVDKMIKGGSDLIVGNSPFVGDVDDLWIYPMVLTQPEITTLYNLSY